MGRKSSSKSQQQPAAAPRSGQGSSSTATSRPSPLILGAVLIAVVGVGMIAFWRPGSGGASTPSSASSTTDGGSPTTGASAAATARAEALSKLGPRKQAALPPIPFQVGYQPPRSNEVITAAYQFAADHPEILSYVPCFCGCERSGHQGNHDCFVKERDANGDVTAWDPHGVDCAVCIDVANRSRQMHAAGASVRSIRAAIDKEFGAVSPSTMGTPHPAHGTH